MMAKEERSGAATVASFGVGTAFGVVMGALMAAKPVEAAEPETKLDYLIRLTEGIGALLELLHKDHLDTIAALQAIALALGAVPPAPPGEAPPSVVVEVTAVTPWRGKEPIQLLSQAVRAAGTIFADSMVNWTEGKRLLIKVESSLNQAIQLQPIGNISNTVLLATDIGLVIACPANGNVSIGFAWDDWQPYVGVRITLPPGITDGILTIWAVVQE
jgi:hypothetical protein